MEKAADGYTTVNGVNVIKPISESDLNSVFGLMKLNMEHYYSQRNEEWNEAKIRDHFLSKNGVVIHKEGEVAGFSFYELKKDRIHIHTLQISPQYQNRTLGGSLFKWYKRLALEVKAKELTCGVYENNPARKIYLKLGFDEIGIVDGVVRMSLPLTSSCTGSLLRRSSVS